MTRYLAGFAGNRIFLFTVTCLMILFVPTTSFAQQDLQDVVYLTNGSIIRGVIIEQIPNTSIKIQTNDGNVFFFEMVEIEKMTKEAKLGSTKVRPMGKTAYCFQPLGFLQFGPIIEAEFLIAPNIYIAPHFRYSALGLLYNAIASEGFRDEVGANSMALGLSFKHFLENPNSSNRFYVGAFTEYGWGSTRGDIDTWDEWEGENAQVILASNFGHRWRYPSKMILNLGIMAGVAKGILGDWWYIDEPGTIIEGSPETYFFGMLEFSIGIEK